MYIYFLYKVELDPKSTPCVYISVYDKKNRAHESLLNDKYQHVYLYDSDTQETRRILHVEWSTAHRPAKYAVVTQFVHGIHENEEDDLVSYYINESLFDCIRAAPLPYNRQRRLIERPN